ncbi:ATP-binding cassette domain-containing protein [Yinghuangia sp. ASG 101]|uniref:ABC transporter ATP-binding protein n=1 Tax=Yinghuangia sp. ASG 101 TaxID=2896848 RepID=UPI001E292A8F|nr:ATP-binding cassette domain-containing protein [Yinghuangia sp. ASG 101]UGQ13886.1 ATP-binding cassette domain-containing protein [Yinghuangia sp. ASG 101]
MIEAQELTRRYGNAVAVDDLSFVVKPGHITAFIGPNGAGKSTALRLMLQLERGGGRTLFCGRRYRELRHPAREVGAWLGATPACPTRRARTELRMLAVAHRIKRARVDEVLELVGLTPVAGSRVGTLSAGAVGRLGIAAALLGDPHTLVLDEPSAGQDPEGARWLPEFLRAFAKQGRTVLIAGHGLTELTDCADRVLAIARGRLVVDESAADFRARATNTQVSVRTPQVDRLAELLRAEGLVVQPRGGAFLAVTGADRARVGEIAFRGGVPIHELAQREASVADAFCAVAAEARAIAAQRAALADAAGKQPRRRMSRKSTVRYARPYLALADQDDYAATHGFDTGFEYDFDLGPDDARARRRARSPRDTVVLDRPLPGPAHAVPAGSVPVSGFPSPAAPRAHRTPEIDTESGHDAPHRRPRRRRWRSRPDATGQADRLGPRSTPAPLRNDASG